MKREHLQYNYSRDYTWYTVPMNAIAEENLQSERIYDMGKKT